MVIDYNILYTVHVHLHGHCRGGVHTYININFCIVHVLFALIRRTQLGSESPSDFQKNVHRNAVDDDGNNNNIKRCRFIVLYYIIWVHDTLYLTVRVLYKKKKTNPSLDVREPFYNYITTQS